MRRLKQLLRPLLIVALLSVFAEGMYRVTFYKGDLAEHSVGLAQLPQEVAASGAEMVYLGESSNHTYSPGDDDTSKISEMVGRFFPDKGMADMTHDGSHGDVYYELLRHLSHTDNQVETVIVTLNMRSFGPCWIYSPLETALQKKLVMLRNRPALVNRAVLTFKAYDVKSDDERYGQMYDYWVEHPLPQHPDLYAWCDTMPPMAQDLVKCYYFSIDTLNNPRVHDFDKMAALAREQGWQLVFNLLAENVELCDSLVGSDLTHQMRQNRDILVEYFSRRGVIVVDNLEVIEDVRFRDRDFPTEHYDQTGRMRIARRIAEALNQ